MRRSIGFMGLRDGEKNIGIYIDMKTGEGVMIGVIKGPFFPLSFCKLSIRHETRGKFIPIHLAWSFSIILFPALLSFF